ncbi:MAG TPA: helix-turn-helix domain-containing protein [Flavobacteriaceae bacterium]|nr:helix-turn-helix domain-containing protein [Flavobacteriaceae bacterium]
MHKVKPFLTFVQVPTLKYGTNLIVRNIDNQVKKNVKKIYQSNENCPVRKSLSLLGGKWTLLILFQINERVIRYGELKRCIPGISEKVLIQKLNHLIENNLVTKKSFPEIPPRVEYRLTQLGLKTLPVIENLALFGLENLKKNVDK